MALECLGFIFSSASLRGIALRHCPTPWLRQILQLARDPVPGCSAGNRAASATCTLASRPRDRFWGSGTAGGCARCSRWPCQAEPAAAPVSPPGQRAGCGDGCGRGGAVDSDHLPDTTRQWDSSPVATVPWGLCAQPCPARLSQPAQVTRTRGTHGCFPLCLYPLGPGVGPLHPQGHLPWISSPWGHLAPQHAFWLLVIVCFLSLPQKNSKTTKSSSWWVSWCLGPAAGGVKATAQPHPPAPPGLGGCGGQLVPRDRELGLEAEAGG